MSRGERDSAAAQGVCEQERTHVGHHSPGRFDLLRRFSTVAGLALTRSRHRCHRDDGTGEAPRLDPWDF